MRTSSVAEETADSVQWSNADIEFPSTSTSDEIEIISQPDDEMICKLLSALPLASESVPNTDDDNNDDKCNLNDENTFEQQSLMECVAATESCEIDVLSLGKCLCFFSLSLSTYLFLL